MNSSYTPDSDTTNASIAAVADPDCRATLRSLRDADGATIPLEKLTEKLTNAQTDGGLSADREVVSAVDATVRLHHVVLPKLADAGLIEYDPDGRVVRCPDSAALERLFAHVAEGGR